MKFLAILAAFVLFAGALAQDEAEEIDVTVLEPEVELCPQTLIDLYRTSRNSCIDEIRANRTASRGQATDNATTEDPTSVTEDIEEELDRCSHDELDEDSDGENTENVDDNRSRRSSGSRRQGSRGRHTRWSRRRKQFFRQFKSCLVNKIKDNTIVMELQTTCVAHCASIVNAAKREAKEKKCMLKKLKQRCPDIVPAQRPRSHRGHRHNNISNHHHHHHHH